MTYNHNFILNYNLTMRFSYYLWLNFNLNETKTTFLNSNLIKIKKSITLNYLRFMNLFKGFCF